MGLPSKLTDEENALLEKYALLKKMRKELQQKQAAAHAETQKTLSTAKKAEGKDVARAPSDAKELAKRKILSGELKITKDGGQREFKRARSLNEKRHDEKSKLDDVESNDIRGDAEKKHMRPPGRNNYENFVAGGRLKDSSPEKQETSRPRHFDRGRRKIFVSGYGLTEAILQNSFTKFGTIEYVHPELDRGQGFITFVTHEAAEKAIAEMHGEMVQNVNLKVCMAGRPYRGDGAFERRSFEDRRPPAARFRNKDFHCNDTAKQAQQDSTKKPDRDLVSYEEDFDF